MFDVAFSELLIIAIVALIVIGPERLPKVARTAGHLIGRARRYMNDVKSEIENELMLQELKEIRSKFQESALAVEAEVRQEMEAAHAEMLQSTQPPVETATAVTDDADAPPARNDGKA